MFQSPLPISFVVEDQQSTSTEAESQSQSPKANQATETSTSRVKSYTSIQGEKHRGISLFKLSAEVQVEVVQYVLCVNVTDREPKLVPL